MKPQNDPYVLFASPREYYASCARFFGDLAAIVPEFYSDATLSAFCCDDLPKPNDAVRESHPISPPSHDTEVLLYTVAKLQIEQYDRQTMGPIVEYAIRAILNDFGLAPPVASLAQLSARLSLVTPKVLVFPAEPATNPEGTGSAAFRLLCMHFAQELLRLPIFSGDGGPLFYSQLDGLSGYVAPDDELGMLPCLNPQEAPEDLTEDQWYEDIEAAALELAEQQEGKGTLRLAPQIIQNGINSLSKVVWPIPPFPNVEPLLTEYCEQNSVPPWRYALETPTPRALLWVKDFFDTTGIHHDRQAPIGKATGASEAPNVETQDDDALVTRFRIRRKLSWPGENSP